MPLLPSCELEMRALTNSHCHCSQELSIQYIFVVHIAFAIAFIETSTLRRILPASDEFVKQPARLSSFDYDIIPLFYAYAVVIMILFRICNYYLCIHRNRSIKCRKACKLNAGHPIPNNPQRKYILPLNRRRRLSAALRLSCRPAA